MQALALSNSTFSVKATKATGAKVRVDATLEH